MTEPGEREIFPRSVVPGGLKSASVKGSVATMLSQGLKMALQFGTQLVLARILFPADFGLLAMIAPIIAIVMIINDLGFGQVVVQRPKIYQLQMSNLFWVNLAMGTALGILIIVSAPVAAHLYGEPRVLALTSVMALMIPLGTLGILPNAFLTRHMRFISLAKIDIGAAMMGSAVTIAAALGGLSYWSLVVGQLVATASTVGGAWALSKWRPSWPTRSISVREEFAFGRNVTGTNLANVVTKSADNLLIGFVEGPVQLGFYDRSYRLLVQPLSQLLLPVNRVAVPLLSSLANDPIEFRKMYLFMVQLLTVATVPGLLICVADGGTVIRFLMSSRWEPATPIFAWFCVGGLTSALYSSASWMFISRNRTGAMLKYWVTASAINLTACAIGIYWGAVGVAAVASTSFVLIQTPLVLRGALRDSPVRFTDVLYVIATPAFSAVLMFAAVRLGAFSHLPSDFLILLAEVVSSYALVAVLLTCSAGGRTFLQQTRRAFGRARRPSVAPDRESSSGG
jgi:PST family polysaccharide transporter